jgi:hypothetical protein
MSIILNPRLWMGFASGALISAGITGHAGGYEIFAGLLVAVAAISGIPFFVYRRLRG